jgi:hypothetical protein
MNINWSLIISSNKYVRMYTPTKQFLQYSFFSARQRVVQNQSGQSFAKGKVIFIKMPILKYFGRSLPNSPFYRLHQNCLKNFSNPLSLGRTWVLNFKTKGKEGRINCLSLPLACVWPWLSQVLVDAVNLTELCQFQAQTRTQGVEMSPTDFPLGYSQSCAQVRGNF